MVTGNHGRLSGRLLVAEPMLGDPNFDRTVVLVLEHADEGAMGLVLNRPTDILVADTLFGWHQFATDDPVVHVGGPVEDRSIWGLARAIDPDDVDGFVPVLGNLGLVDLRAEPESVHAWVTDFRMYVGYSGWGPGQLEYELAAESWFVVDADPGDPFLADSTDLWPRILARQGGSLSRLATFPRDPSLN